MSKDKTEFFLYGKRGCCTCDTLKATLERINIHYHLIDIEGDPELVQRYGARIPVLVTEGVELCEGPFEESALRDLLKQYRT